MEREQLVSEARRVGEAAKHNLQLIRQNPDAMLPGEQDFAEGYLNNMIRVAEAEMKNDRRPGQSGGLKSRLENLLVSILTPKREKRKEGAA
ncbi:hypothetical protein C162_20511 [Paenibacillus sp. FSL R7-269]|uniref:hypothetical protein n=1 Tax=Paenibacillus sp. FSL R7-269 TaxID=1226755 RepID=UPI0003E2C554|nr:hypothetical protein [Paenibacillus sp. FSL R7-269]ETT45754.1 hypothetical protein C162_20511 [Paenibacillus sp. FSL R7-269]